MATTVMAGAGCARELARLLRAVAYPDGVLGGYEIANPVEGWRVHVDPTGVIDVWTTDGTAVIRGALATPQRVVALLGGDALSPAELAAAERFRPTPAGRW